MPVDTRRKRASVVSLASVWMGASVVPDGSFNQADRQTIGWSYFGILAGVGGGPVYVHSHIRRLRRMGR